MKQAATRSLALIAILFVFAFLIWAILQHGTIGALRVNNKILYLFILIGVFGLVLALLLIWQIRLSRRSLTRGSRILTVLVLIISIISIIIFPVATAYLEGAPASGVGDTGPQLSIADGSGAYGIPDLAVTFNSANKTLGTLKWGKVNAQTSSREVQEKEPTRQHVFMLRDLEPATQYWYQINDSTAYYFTTAGTNGETLRFAVGSDAQFGAGDNRADLSVRILKQISAPANKYDLFFYLGDLVEYGFRDSLWNQALNIFSQNNTNIPVRLIPGNHDTLFGGLARYQNYSYPPGMDLQTGSRLWYRIDVGKVHFLLLDLEWSAESYTAEQAAWLETQLKNIPASDWKIVMSHGFYYASGSIVDGWRWYDNPETISKLTPLFQKYGVDIVFSGHDHQLELLKNSGVTYVIAGGFGGIPDPAATYRSPSSVWYAPGQYGFADVAINGNQANLTFRSPDSASLQSFSITKQSQN